jgi:hypothetical protein
MFRFVFALKNNQKKTGQKKTGGLKNESRLETGLLRLIRHILEFFCGQNLYLRDQTRKRFKMQIFTPSFKKGVMDKNPK